MREQDRVLYTQITRQHGGQISVNSVIETVLVDDAGAVIGVKSGGGYAVNHIVDKADAATMTLVDELGLLPLQWRAEELAALRALAQTRAEELAAEAQRFAAEAQRLAAEAAKE